MLLENLQACVHTRMHAQALTKTTIYSHKNTQHTYLYTLIPLFSSPFRLLSSLILPTSAAKLSPEQLNNHRGFQLAELSADVFIFSRRENIAGHNSSQYVLIWCLQQKG